MKKDYFLGLSEEGFHKIAYTEWGEVNTHRTPIICVHGLTRNRSDFDSLSTYFSALGHHLYCPDIVGRGDSDWLKNPLHYTYEQYIADMTTLIARTGAAEINWIGTSMGGLIGMILASLPQSPIRRLVMNDIGPQIPVKALARLSEFVGKDPTFTSLEEAKNHYKQIYSEFGALSEADWQHLTENSIREIAPGKFISKTDQAVTVSSAKSKLAWKLLLNPLKALEGTFFDIDLWELWAKVTCPVLIIHGEHSDILLPDTIKKMQARHAQIEVVEIPNTGHAPGLRNVEQQEIIHQWLMK